MYIKTKNLAILLTLVLFISLIPRSIVFAVFDEEVQDFTVESSDKAMNLSWTNPLTTDYAGTMVVRSEEDFEFIPEAGKVYHYGEEVSDGVVVVYYSTGDNFIDFPLKNGVDYIYQAFNVNYNVDYSIGSEKITLAPEEDTLSPAPPNNLLGESGDNSIYLSWEESDSNDVSKYTVYCKEETTEEMIVRDALKKTYYLLEGVSNGSTYLCQVTALDFSNNESEPSNEVTILVGENNDTTPPLPVMDLTGNLENNKIVLSWTKNYDLDLAYYKIFISSDNNDELIDQTEESLFIFQNVKANTTYFFQVASIDTSGNESDKSNEVEVAVGDLEDTDFTSENDFLAAPTNLDGEIQQTLVNLFWEGQEGDGYTIFKRCGESSYFSKINKNLIFEFNYEVANLNAGERCEFFVKSANKDGLESGPSNIFTAFIPSTFGAGAEISGVEILTGNNQIAVNFNGSNISNLAGYNIYLNGDLISPPSPLNNPYLVLSDLDNGDQYEVRITVLDNLGRESAGNTFKATPPSSHLDANFGQSSEDWTGTEKLNSTIEIADDNEGKPEITWDLDSSDGTAGYNLYRGTEAGDLKKINTGYLITEVPFIDTDTVSGEKYIYEIASIGFDGEELGRSKSFQFTSHDSANLGYFHDVPPSNDFFDFVEELRVRNIVKGYSGHYYKPYQPITRIESLKMIMKTAGIEINDNLRFHDYLDIEKDFWGYPFVEKATYEGVVKGYTDGLFRPNQNISRVEFLKMVMNAGQLAISKTAISPFYDDKGFWGSAYIGSAYNLGIVSGYSKYEFGPNRPISRAEAAKIVNGLISD